mmetsp:Transcript_31065/g.63023  ORF Transcript_31065/g.63023 Transcript_31065/m.63023 type:complete len:284 (-) Transcript_31065:94-945(-)|eukprot:CAMPEP_0171906620 /NCGR_PEP_ID=MMETSP0993-20121228/6294_1 /TAXON_ID=483369 /ORGANISM="non described non described, Strain CCMP2098" /LENGTH=283 /DNA_ID=CAMNT_0012538591 /DNA_START=23 /DNA_END=874 /DNA_ORIENTATION=+
MADLTNFSGSASDMLSMMKAAGITEEGAEQAAMSAATAPPSEPEECTDPTHDHSHGGHHHHGHDHGHDGSSDHAGGSDHDDDDDSEGGDEAVVAAEDAESAENALKENIARKGKNAYYYAHAGSANGPKWDGDPTPRLLETTKKPSSSSAAVAGGGGGGGSSVAVKKIAKFAWGDEEGKVKVYIDFVANGIISGGGEDQPAAMKVEKEVSFTSKSVTLTLLAPSPSPGASLDRSRMVSHVLDFPELNDKIDKATCVVKATKAILTLTKSPDSNFKWHNLRKNK